MKKVTNTMVTITNILILQSQWWVIDIPPPPNLQQCLFYGKYSNVSIIEKKTCLPTNMSTHKGFPHIALLKPLFCRLLTEPEVSKWCATFQFYTKPNI